MESFNTSSSIFQIQQHTEGRLAEQMHLKNGLTLEIFDRSRYVAGDRWLVFFEAKIDVEVNLEYLPDQLSLNAVRSKIGERVTYRYEKSRNFIDEKEVGKIFSELKEKFLETSLGYLSSPEFPQKLILRKYKDAISLASVWQNR